MSELPEYGADDAFYVLDLHCFVHRFFHTIGGRCAHGVIEFIGKIIRERDPRYFAVCYDTPHPTFRHRLAPRRTGEGTGYKEHRNEAPDATLLERLRWSREMIEDLFGIPCFGLPGYEADDLIGALTHRAKASGLRVVLIAMDKDLLQLVDDRCVMWDGKHAVMGPAEVEAKYGVRAEQFRDYLATVGDGVDNVPGIDGCGPTAARAILGTFGTLDAALEAASVRPYRHPLFEKHPRYMHMLNEQREQALLSQKLVTLALDAPVRFDADQLRRT